MNVATLPPNGKLAVSIVTYFKTAGKVRLCLKFKYGTYITKKPNIKKLRSFVLFFFYSKPISFRYPFAFLDRVKCELYRTVNHESGGVS